VLVRAPTRTRCEATDPQYVRSLARHRSAADDGGPLLQYDSSMIEASCHCGGVRLKVEVDGPPAELTSCNCSICRRLGTLWTYYAPAQVRVTGATKTYRWGDRTLDLHHCATCGCATHWTPVDAPPERMGVNARLMDPAVVAAARIRHLDGADTWKYLDEPPNPLRRGEQPGDREPDRR
jgi:hypothetical protein